VDVVRHTVPDNVHQLHVQTTFHVWKTRACQCSFRLLMMGGVSTETCRASYKYGITKFWCIVAACWILFYEWRVAICYQTVTAVSLLVGEHEPIYGRLWSHLIVVVAVLCDHTVRSCFLTNKVTAAAVVSITVNQLQLYSLHTRHPNCV